MKTIFWGQPNQTNLVRKGEFIVPQPRTLRSKWIGMSQEFLALDGAPTVQTGVGALTTVRATPAYVYTGKAWTEVEPNKEIWVGDELYYYPEAVNLCTNSAATGSRACTVGIGKVSIVVYVNEGDTAQAEVTSGTATGTGYGTATHETPLELDITVGGTINVNISGTPFTVNVVQAPVVHGETLPPIPAAGTPFTMDSTQYSFDAANHDNANGVWAIGVHYPLSRVEMNNLSTKDNGLLSTSQVASLMHHRLNSIMWLASWDGVSMVTVSTNWAPAANLGLALAYHAGDAQQMLRSKAFTDVSTEGSYDGDYGTVSTIKLCWDMEFVVKVKELRRYSITSYQQGKEYIEAGLPPFVEGT